MLSIFVHIKNKLPTEKCVQTNVELTVFPWSFRKRIFCLQFLNLIESKVAGRQ